MPPTAKTDLSGLRIDFTRGARVVTSPGCGYSSANFTDLSGKTGVAVTADIRTREKTAITETRIKYFVPWRVTVMDTDGKEVLRHDLNLTGQPVLIDMAVGALGDTVAWMPAVDAFRRKWQPKRMIVAMRTQYICLYQSVYPDIEFIPPPLINRLKAEDTYARYRIAVWGYGDTAHELLDFRRNNLQLHADMILGVSSNGKPPKIGGEEPEKRDDKLICIATRASRKCKEWNCPGGWEKIASALTERGYRVVCIDADNRNMPQSAIDDTGMKPLLRRAETLKRASLFIGLPSGLSWVAWACNVPVVLISGFSDVVRPDLPSQRYPEFDTPYRVSPPPWVCRNCWATGDQRLAKIFDECYRQKNNECTRAVTSEMVMTIINKALKEGEQWHIAT